MKYIGNTLAIVLALARSHHSLCTLCKLIMDFSLPYPDAMFADSPSMALDDDLDLFDAFGYIFGPDRLGGLGLPAWILQWVALL